MFLNFVLSESVPVLKLLAIHKALLVGGYSHLPRNLFLQLLNLVTAINVNNVAHALAILHEDLHGEGNWGDDCRFEAQE